MTHSLVSQLRFTRSEFMRGVKGVSDDDARKRLLPMNCISWNIGHLTWQEQRYFLRFGQGKMLLPEIDRSFANGAPASTPSLDEVLSAWRPITSATDPWLDTLTSSKLEQHVISNGKQIAYKHGNLLQRVIYHYWYHIGENLAIRQQLGHKRLPQFVGAIDSKAPYRPESKRANDNLRELSMTNNVTLRDVTESDLPILFEQQLDPEATAMAVFPSRDRESFMKHWAKIMVDESVILKTILFNGQVAGSIVSWEQSGEREIGYWLGREFWGKELQQKHWLNMLVS